MSTPPITLELPSDLYTQLQEMADTEEKGLVALIEQLLAEATKQKDLKPKSAFKNILSYATDLGVTDLAENHGHYFYGVDKT